MASEPEALVADSELEALVADSEPEALVADSEPEALVADSELDSELMEVDDSVPLVSVGCIACGEWKRARVWNCPAPSVKLPRGMACED